MEKVFLKTFSNNYIYYKNGRYYFDSIIGGKGHTKEEMIDGGWEKEIEQLERKIKLKKLLK